MLHANLLAKVPGGQGAMAIVMWVVVFAALYFLLIRPQKNKEKRLNEMRNNVAVGDKVVTLSGVVATVAKVEEEQVVIELGPSRTKVPIMKWGIGTVVEKKEQKSDDEKSDDDVKTAEKLSDK